VYDLLLKGGTVIDGTGAPSYQADVAIADGVIVEIGRITDAAHETVDADGALITPGFVDPHTHYDGQATWDHQLAPSCWHGVTTAILGNCGVGFAPVRPDRHDFLVQLMEGVEDIPGTALHEGIRWSWESFPEYLDALEATPRLLDIGTHLPHGSLRAYVMDERGAANELATADDIARMAQIAEEAMRAGALGFSTNRLPSHTAKDGRPVPGTFADDDELLAIGRAMARGGGGVVEVVSAESMGVVDGGYQKDIAWATALSLETGLPITFCLTQIDNRPDRWRDVLKWIDEARAKGAHFVVQTAGRPLGILVGLTTKHQFTGRPSFDEVANLPLPQLVAALRDPERKRRILAETGDGPGIGRLLGRLADKAWPLDDPPDYEPDAAGSVAAMARDRNVSVDEVYYDLYLRHDGRQLVLFTLGGYGYRNTDHIVELLSYDSAILGLADGGAHVSLICDASTSTSLLSYYVRDRTRGPRLGLETAVQKMTSGPAQLYGLHDRGTVAVGKKADLNVIDFGHLNLRMPEVIADLPTGAPRIVQRADGYLATIVSGAVTLRDGEETGARPGRLVRRLPH
jgi:N-acyl-D-aspartate/D-glutamate deacylase